VVKNKDDGPWHVYAGRVRGQGRHRYQVFDIPQPRAKDRDTHKPQNLEMRL